MQSNDYSSMSSSSGSEGALCDLLNQEYYLSKILERLVDDGLQECRRVCRKWYEVSNRLPVKLIRVRPETLPILAERFPNAVGWDLTTKSFSVLKPADARQLETKKRLAVVQALAHLSRFRKLKNLTFVFYPLAGDGIRWRPISEGLGACFQSFQQLVSLNAGMELEEEEAMCFASQLRFLTNLTCLTLWMHPCPLPVEPFTELKKIATLGVHDYLTIQNRELMFPALTNLTHLIFCHTSETCTAQYKGGILEMLLPYASSLKLLSINCDRPLKYLPFPNDWLLLREFTHLATLSIWMADKVCYSTLHKGLSLLTSLTCLEHVRIDAPAQLAEHPPFLMGLRDLVLSGFLDDRTISEITSASQLTRLQISLANRSTGLPLSRLSNLIHLELTVSNGHRVNLPEILICMPLLQSLALQSFMTWLQLPSWCLEHLTKLASLKVTAVVLDRHFFSSLSSLQRLTELVVVSHPKRRFPRSDVDWDSMLDISLLTNLEKLTILEQNNRDPRSYLLQGCLSRLKYLHINGNLSTPEIRSVLFSRLPSLRKITPS